MSNYRDIAEAAFFSLDRKTRLELGQGSDQVLPPDLMGYAERLAERCFNLMHERGTRDPRTHARMTADEAAIRYVKLRLLGEEPDSDKVFAALVTSWSRLAARDDTT